jgi:hypothetical protein
LGTDGKEILKWVLNKQNGMGELNSCVLGQEQVVGYSEKGTGHNFIK